MRGASIRFGTARIAGHTCGTVNRMAKYIDADELLKLLNACKYPSESTTMRRVTYNAAISEACRIVDAIPAADVEPVRHGRWVDVEGYEGLLYRCSACEDKRYKHTTVKYNYCPNCGSRMDLESEDG